MQANPELPASPNIPQHWASASWAWLLLECSYPWDKFSSNDDAGEAARYGSAFHALIARLLRGFEVQPPLIEETAKTWGVAKFTEELEAHVRSSHDYFEGWLSGRNEFRIKWAGQRIIEQAVALAPLKSGRIIAPHDEDHRYTDLLPGEMPGTLDLAIHVKGKELLVEDHKTGMSEEFTEPSKKPQLLVLGAAAMRAFKRRSCIVAVLHSPRRGLPKVYAERVLLKDLMPFEHKLRQALERIGDGSMRPGAHCNRCPFDSVCPAREAKLLEKAGDVLTGLTVAGQSLTGQEVEIAPQLKGAITPERRDGTLYEIARLAESMAGRIREQLRERMLADPRHLPEIEGGYLAIRTYERENISKSSIVQALGKVAGEAELTRLRGAGAITKKTVTAVYPERERGK